ncbi:cupin domain-containing protein [Ramlibacter albus]|uniref:Cupin domain-containing protein n=1 Tax=Ramlibacter albus TaxID=2079448 RepID=A0A923ME66_9BURK|nr:cupin domain-containing protein [Ramlibacter albus]MBC5767848.1 cupin domain-containing protein [Ramlibacter albus]
MPTPFNPPELCSHFVDAAAMPWSPTQFEGIEMKILYSDDDGRSAILFKLAPGAVVPLHEHQALEMTYMLEGDLTDHEGSCTPGNFVWRPGGNRHIAHSKGGAVFLSIFNKPNLFESGTRFFTEAQA